MTLFDAVLAFGPNVKISNGAGELSFDQTNDPTAPCFTIALFDSEGTGQIRAEGDTDSKTITIFMEDDGDRRAKVSFQRGELQIFARMLLDLCERGSAPEGV